uniref:Uncharacterized protein n=1 Tax=Chromera velia CCMP2878 TaxID=1169474 RepID=A0A0G4GJT5_9ALVE|eukprot:Cvel_4810.t1-p1 / transcript=Cvel_4810.t1 / gene=Cvel_4810 / organism=Chromera_velia_CCMP2878 / gene_product=hypothetical protein / transcript_product=hypothetical protein / location=Cvel_scaffold215:87957-114772(-) / protein_length=852 / sequence_SO=supercontig / SO=protein_coding / is_pseudo=false
MARQAGLSAWLEKNFPDRSKLSKLDEREAKSAFRAIGSVASPSELSVLIKELPLGTTPPSSVSKTTQATGQLEESVRWARTVGTIEGAASANKPEVIRWLAEEKGVNLKAHSGHDWAGAATLGQLAGVLAAESGSLLVLSLCKELSIQWHPVTPMAAAKRGRLSVLKWLQEEGGCMLCEGVEAAARAERQTAVLQWTRNQQLVPRKKPCPLFARELSEQTDGQEPRTLGYLRAKWMMDKTGAVGSAESVAWLVKDKGLTLAPGAGEDGWGTVEEGRTRGLLTGAARGNNVDVLRCVEKGCPVDEARVRASAEEKGQSGVLKWLDSHKTSLKSPDQIEGPNPDFAIRLVSKYGDLEKVKNLGLSAARQCMRDATEHADMKDIRWLVGPKGMSLPLKATGTGGDKVVEAARLFGLVEGAARWGKLEMLLWADEEKKACLWKEGDKQTALCQAAAEAAARGGKEEVLNFLEKRGLRLVGTGGVGAALAVLAADEGHLGILHWLRKRGVQVGPQIFTAARAKEKEREAQTQGGGGAAEATRKGERLAEDLRAPKPKPRPEFVRRLESEYGALSALVAPEKEKGESMPSQADSNVHKFLLMDAAEVGNVDDIRWLVEEAGFSLAVDVWRAGYWSKGWRRTLGLLLGAANGNRVETLQWAVEKKGVDVLGQGWWQLVPLGANREVLLAHGQVAMCNAAKRGNREVIGYLRLQGVPLVSEVAEHAAVGGQIGTLDWLVSNPQSSASAVSLRVSKLEDLLDAEWFRMVTLTAHCKCVAETVLKELAAVKGSPLKRGREESDRGDVLMEAVEGGEGREENDVHMEAVEEGRGREEGDISLEAVESGGGREEDVKEGKGVDE